MNVLQLGTENWAQKYQIPSEIKWIHNSYPDPMVKRYNLVIITKGATLDDDCWRDLQWQVEPYCVLYSPFAEKDLSPAAIEFIRRQEARQIVENPQLLIDQLPIKYFSGQSGTRIAPTKLLLNHPGGTFLDNGHLRLKVSSEQWVNLGAYQQNIYIDPHRVLKFNLEFKRETPVQVRLRIFVQDEGGDGNPMNNYLLYFNGEEDEQELPIAPADSIRYANINVEVKGIGTLELGMLHSRWSRAGNGEFLPGGKRLTDPLTGENIAYYFNPGDLRPPLHIYFSGARGLEGFEAYPLFRKNHTPALLFTDPRLEVGQFYTGKTFEERIKTVIKETLDNLGFTNQQLVINGISMGTYPAVKLGAQLSPYAINVAKPTLDLGWVALRGRLERPDDFDTIFDIDQQLVTELTDDQLKALDAEFWQQLASTDLTKTRLYVGYMKDDDYDNVALQHLQENSAVKDARLFVNKGFPGRHNDNNKVVQWFISRLKEINQNFGRGE